MQRLTDEAIGGSIALHLLDLTGANGEVVWRNCEEDGSDAAVQYIRGRWHVWADPQRWDEQVFGNTLDLVSARLLTLWARRVAWWEEPVEVWFLRAVRFGPRHPSTAARITAPDGPKFPARKSWVCRYGGCEGVSIFNSDDAYRDCLEKIQKQWEGVR